MEWPSILYTIPWRSCREEQPGENLSRTDRRDLEPFRRENAKHDESHQDDELRALAGQGKIRLAEDELDETFWDLPAPRVPVDTLRRVLIRERDETTVGLL